MMLNEGAQRSLNTEIPGNLGEKEAHIRAGDKYIYDIFRY